MFRNDSFRHSNCNSYSLRLYVNIEDCLLKNMKDFGGTGNVKLNCSDHS